MIRLEHVGIAVDNLEEANQLFARLFGKRHYKEEIVPEEEVTTSFYLMGDTKIELVAANEGAEGPITKFVARRGPGIHHLAFEVEDIHKSMQDMVDRGFTLLNDTPKIGADNKLICFLHPKTTNGVLVELCQSISAGK